MVLQCPRESLVSLKPGFLQIYPWSWVGHIAWLLSFHLVRALLSCSFCGCNHLCARCSIKGFPFSNQPLHHFFFPAIFFFFNFLSLDFLMRAFHTGASWSLSLYFSFGLCLRIHEFEQVITGLLKLSRVGVGFTSWTCLLPCWCRAKLYFRCLAL